MGQLLEGRVIAVDAHRDNADVMRLDIERWTGLESNIRKQCRSGVWSCTHRGSGDRAPVTVGLCWRTCAQRCGGSCSPSQGQPLVLFSILWL